MDEAIFSMIKDKGRNKSWAETMVFLEAEKLIYEANRVSMFHLSDSFARMDFVKEIKDVVENQFDIARKAKSDEECIQCVRTLRQETEALKEQDWQLRSKAAQLYAKVEFVRENNKIVGYIISAVSVVISGIEAYAGAMMISTMTPIGVLAGAVLVVDGINGITREAINQWQGDMTYSEGIFADAAMEAAEFMGFKAETGFAFYNAISLSAGICGILGLTLRSGARRLFRWIPTDYYRKVSKMSRPKLAMRIAGFGLKSKVIFDLISIDQND